MDNKAFTLIELLVVTAIILLFSGISLTRFNNYTQELKLKSEAKKLIDIVELAKKKAFSGDLSGKTCNGVFNGYEVNIQADNYSLNLRCTIAPTIQQIAIYNFSNSVIYAQSGIGLFRFKQLDTGLQYKVNEASDPSSPPTIQIKNSSISKCIDITISSVGIVELYEALTSC